MPGIMRSPGLRLRRLYQKCTASSPVARDRSSGGYFTPSHHPPLVLRARFQSPRSRSALARDPSSRVKIRACLALEKPVEEAEKCTGCGCPVPKISALFNVLHSSCRKNSIGLLWNCFQNCIITKLEVISTPCCVNLTGFMCVNKIRDHV